MPRLSIIVNENGTGEVRLDGELIPEVVAVGFNTGIDEPTEVTLVLSPMDVEVTAPIDLARVFVTRRKPAGGI